MKVEVIMMRTGKCYRRFPMTRLQRSAPKPYFSWGVAPGCHIPRPWRSDPLTERNQVSLVSDVRGRGGGSSQTEAGRLVIRLDVPSACGSCSSLRKIFPDETARCKSTDLRNA